MKMIALLAAAAVATFAIPATASAAPISAGKPVVSHAAAAEAFYQRRHRRAYWRTVCKTERRGHRRVRVCRKVRAWR